MASCFGIAASPIRVSREEWPWQRHCELKAYLKAIKAICLQSLSCPHWVDTRLGNFCHHVLLLLLGKTNL